MYDYGNYGFNPLLNNGQQQNFGFSNAQKPNGNYFYVNGLIGAKSFLVNQPNSKVVLFDSDSNDFFIKATDSQGQATIHRFEYSEKSVEEVKPQPEKINMEEYVTKKDFEEFKAQIKALNTNNVQQPQIIQQQAQQPLQSQQVSQSAIPSTNN